MKKIKIVLLMFSFFLILSPKALAQNLDLGIYPPVIEIQANPPTDFKVPVFIQNFTDQSQDLTLTLKLFKPSKDENGTLIFSDVNLNDYPDPFILQRIQVFDETNKTNKFTISPKQRKDLVLQVQIPANEPKGEYYISMIFSTNPNASSSNNSTEVSASIVSNILLSVGPLGNTQGVLEEFSSPTFLFKGPVPFTIRLRNTSDHYINPKGNIIIENMFGQAIGKVDLLPVNILSNSVRRIPDSLQSGTAKQSDYQKIQAIVDANSSPVAIWPENFLVGPYTATLTIALSDNGPVFVRKTTFFAFPAEYILGILIIIGIVVFIAVRVRKKINLKYQ